MKKTSLLLVFVMLLNLFVAFPASAANLTDLITPSTVFWTNAGWGDSTVPYAIDGNYSTILNQGKHSAGAPQIRINVSDDNSKKYNKFKVYTTRWNSSYFELLASNTLNGAEPTSTSASVDLTDPVSLVKETFATPRKNDYVGEYVVTMGFDAVNYKYISLRSQVADASNEGLCISELELYYATPSSIDISNVPVKIPQGTAKTITPNGVVKDKDNDAVMDSDLNGITWSINDSAEGVTVDSSTGVVTVSASAPCQTVVLTATSTATGYTSVSASKSFKIENSDIHYIAHFGDGTEIAEWIQSTDRPGLEKNSLITKGTSEYSARFRRTEQTAWIQTPEFATQDWSGYSYLNMWVYSDKANNAVFIPIAYDKVIDNTSSATSEYLRKHVTIDWTGWKLLSFPLSSFISNTDNVSWKTIYKFAIAVNGWGVTQNTSTDLYFDSIWLSKDAPVSNSYSKIAMKKTGTNVVKATATASIGVDGTDVILAVGAYTDGKLTNISYATSSNYYGDVTLETSVDYTDGQEVRAFMFEDLEKVALVASETIYGQTDDIWMPSIFGSDSVLQRNTKLNVWGTAPKGSTVTVELDGKKYTATANSSTGKWSVKTNPITVERNPYTMTVTSSTGGKKVFNNILAGEVWLCSGQSNMQYKISQTMPEEANEPINKNIRVFRQTMWGTEDPDTDVQYGNWKEMNSTVVKDFSGVGYFFGKNLQEGIDVPVGLIYAAYGGSIIEAWMSNETLVNGSYPDRANVVVTDDANGFRDSSHLYNKMIHPIIPYNIAGCIWYQGCTNSGRYYEYLNLQKECFDSWRAEWGYDFPVIITQLAAWGGANVWPLLREAQWQYAQDYKDKKVWMAVILDTGEENNIHPKDKETPGTRLAKIALNRVYGKSDVAYQYPNPVSYSISGNKVTITFEGEYNGLRIGADGKGTTLNTFQVSAGDDKWYNATATISGTNKVVVSSSKVSSPKAVRAGFSNWLDPKYNLYNSAGLVATSFRLGTYTYRSMGTVVE